MKMRRGLLLGLAGLLMSVASPAQAQFAYTEFGQFADSSWLMRQGDDLNFYFSMAFRSVNAFAAPGVVSDERSIEGWGGIGKGSCFKGKHMIMCSASGRIYPLATGNFDFDPALGSAYMKLDERKDSAELFWTGKGDMSPGVGADAGAMYAAAAAGAVRHASIEGTMWGEKISKRSPVFSDLYEVAGGFVAAPGRSYSFADDGTVTVRIRIPIGS
jgi:hypothetical protein